MYASIDISNQMLEDSAFDMEGEIRGEATEQLAVKEDAMIRGTVRAGQQSCSARPLTAQLRTVVTVSKLAGTRAC